MAFLLIFFNNFYLRKENGIEKFINFCESDVELNKYLQKDETKMKNIFSVYKKDIKKLSDFADLSSDELIGGFDEIKGKKIRIDGYLEEFSLSRDEADQLIMSARDIVFK